MAALVFLITGTTSGIGLALVQHVLARGDKVIATGRSIHTRLADLKAQSRPDQLALLELDITSPPSVLADKAKEAWSIFGHIDILLNNAGMSAMCSAEEASEQFISTMFSVNFTGPLNVTQAFLPYMRSHAAAAAAAATSSSVRSRPVIAYTSSSSFWTPLPFMSHYAASKAALSAYVESLGSELESLGVDVVAFECGGCPTHLGQPRAGTVTDNNKSSSSSSTSEIQISAPTKMPEVYGEGVGKLVGMFTRDPMAFMPGDLERVAETMVDVLKKDGRMKERGLGWSKRVVIGSDAWESVKVRCEQMLVLLERWKAVSWGTDRDGVRGGAEGDYLKWGDLLGDL
ncbi:putative dehydrogenase [Cladorrhinum sp. PSN259]|nr:putative dehydrogenase [Cladorrhinum sp. PSN259]